MILLFLLAITSVLWARRRQGALFSFIHVSLGISALVLLLFHFWLARPAGTSLEAKVPLTVAAAIWLCAAMYRCLRLRRVRATVTTIHDAVGSTSSRNPKAAFLDVGLDRTISIHPGAYFYLFFEQSGWRQYRGEPMMAYGWEGDGDSQTWQRNTKMVKKLKFLVQVNDHLSSALSERTIALAIDGPYGRDPQLHKFDTVVLAADGAGILAVFPLAVQLAERNYYDQSIKVNKSGRGLPEHHRHELIASMHRDRTRQVNIIWIMRESWEFGLIANRLEELAALDSRTVSAKAPPHLLVSRRTDEREALVHFHIIKPNDEIDSKEAMTDSIPGGFRKHWVVRTWSGTLDGMLRRYIGHYLDTSPGDYAAAGKPP